MRDNNFIFSMVLTISVLAVCVGIGYLLYAKYLSLTLSLLAASFSIFLLLYLTIERFLQSEQKELEDLQKEEIENLKKIEIYRREFLAEVSHELRTPIFAVQGFIHTLMDGAIDDEKVREKFLHKAMKNTDRLSTLVNDLMIITQIEAGELEMRIRRFNIHELLLEVVESLEYKMTDKGRNITCHIKPNGNRSVQVLADRERIQQVLTNLIDNAIKYGNPTGNITVSLQKIEAQKLHIFVKDDGQGISEEHLDKIFRRFYRVDKSRSRERGGTGLGLAICKHFIEAHNEAIQVESICGEGTTFSFPLKLAED
ncbi:MAG: sensor histidine kinase [Bacteroidia bacterium]